VIENNLVIGTRSSWSLLTTDQTPGSFWIMNPFNYFRGNHAAGGDRYGFWFDLRENSEGPSASPYVCPVGMPLGEFKDNVIHSYQKYGLRIFHELIPRTRPCDPAADWSLEDPYSINPPIPAIFENTLSYKNKFNGIIGERLGDVRFINSKLADNLVGGVEISEPNYSPLYNSTRVLNALIVGISANPTPPMRDFNYFNTRGVITGRAEGLLVEDVRFYNFNARMAAFGSCSHCWHPAARDSGGRTTKFSKLSFNNVTVRIAFIVPRNDIFQDLDGTFTDLPGGGWITPFYPHLAVPECKYDPLVFDGVVCNNKVQVRRIAFFHPEPLDPFKGMPLNVWRIEKNVDVSTLNRSQKSVKYNTV
jgi:hypothetical protein